MNSVQENLDNLYPTEEFAIRSALAWQDYDLGESRHAGAPPRQPSFVGEHAVPRWPARAVYRIP
jgi:hypothetical protein